MWLWLGYASPPDMVRRLPELLKEAVESQGYTLVHGGLNGFATGGLKYDVEFESTAPDFPADAHDLVAAILDIFQKNDVGFAYPTQVNLLAKKTKPAPPATPAAEPETAPGK